MVDWASLKKLKLHSNILTLIILGLIAFLAFTPRHFLRGTLVKYKPIEMLAIKSKKGVHIRSIPSVQGTSTILAPYNAKLKVINIEASPDTVNGTIGYWHKVEYYGTVGYVWGHLVQ